MQNIIDGLKDAVRFARGEPVAARVTTYPVTATTLVRDWGRSYPEVQQLSDAALGDLMRRIANLVS